MNAIWITSMILQWAMILTLSLLVLSLMRQLGERQAPSTEKNPDDIFQPFSELPEEMTFLIDGRKFFFGGPDSPPTLIVFFSPKCSACEQLPGAIRDLVAQPPSPDFRILAVLKRIDREGAEGFIRDEALQHLPIALEEDFPAHLNPGGAPYAAALAANGKVAARGKPKTVTHLREMIFAAQNMAHMAPSHSRKSHEWGESVPYWSPEQLTGPKQTTTANIIEAEAHA